MKYIVNENEVNRLDKYLIDKLDISRSKIQEMVKQHLILVNEKEVKSSYQLKENDEVSVLGNLIEETNATPEKMDLDIIYEDDDVMVINKPTGLVVHPSSGHFTGTLVNGLLYHTNNLSDNNGDIRPGIVHRIDKDTSGLLVVAKNNKAHEKLAEQLKDKTLSRIYIALVEGRINHDTGSIDAPIGRDINDRKKMCVTDENSKEAVTHFKVLERFKRATLIECKLETGRTHQIRVHMNYINHPVVGDPVYGYKKNKSAFGQMLHAKEIGFIHPKTGKYMTFKCDVPKEFNEIVEKYRNE